jgi:hypothetical protein
MALFWVHRAAEEDQSTAFETLVGFKFANASRPQPVLNLGEDPVSINSVPGHTYRPTWDANALQVPFPLNPVADHAVEQPKKSEPESICEVSLSSAFLRMPFGPEEWDAARPTGNGWHQKISNDSWGALHDDCDRAPRSNTGEKSSQPSGIETEQSVGFHGDTGIAVGRVRIYRAIWGLWIEKNSEGQSSFRQSFGKPIKEWQAVVGEVSLDNPHLPHLPPVSSCPGIRLRAADRPSH